MDTETEKRDDGVVLQHKRNLQRPLRADLVITEIHRGQRDVALERKSDETGPFVRETVVFYQGVTTGEKKRRSRHVSVVLATMAWDTCFAPGSPMLYTTTRRRVNS